KSVDGSLVAVWFDLDLDEVLALDEVPQDECEELLDHRVVVLHRRREDPLTSPRVELAVLTPPLIQDRVVDARKRNPRMAIDRGVFGDVAENSIAYRIFGEA